MREALRDRWLLGLLAVGLLLRIALALFVHGSTTLIADDFFYAQGAQSLLETGEIKGDAFVRPPFYFVFLAAIRLLADDWQLTARIVQCALGAGAAIPVYRTTRTIAGPRSARMAAGFLLLDPTLIAYCHLFWPETLFLLLVSVVFDGVGRLAPGDRRQALALGMVSGIALLVKPVFGLFTLLLAGWWVLRWGWLPALRTALPFGLAAAIVASPWVLHNQLRFGPAIIFENQVPYNLWVGNDPRPPMAILNRWNALPDPVTRSRVGFEKGLEAIRSDVPGFLQRSAGRALNLWGLEFFVLRNLTRGGYGRIGKDDFLAIFWILQAGYAVLLICFALGIPRARRAPALGLLLAYAAAFTLLVCMMAGTTRFRIPFSFLLSAGAGIGLDRLLAWRVSREAWAATALALLLLGSSASRPLFREIVAGHYEDPRELHTISRLFFRY